MLPAFRHHRPAGLPELLELLERHGREAKVLAGGTDLVPKLRGGKISVAHLVSINGVEELARIEYDDAGGLVIGAGARIADVGAHRDVQKRYPALAHACSVMATNQVRNMGTVAGNLANGSPCADTGSPLLCYDASLLLASTKGRRKLPLSDFFKGPGLVDIRKGEILESIHVPPPRERTQSAYLRLSARSRVDMAAVGVAACLVRDGDGKVTTARLALTAVAPTHLRCPEAEDLLVGRTPDAGLFERCAAACAKTARPIDDVRASAAYRRSLVAVLATRVLAACVESGGGRAQ